jgi:hypothetical protein
LYPSSAPKEEKEEKDDADEEEDIEAMIAKEVATMSNKQPKSQKRFANIQTDTDCGNANYIYEDNISGSSSTNQSQSYSFEQIHLLSLFLLFITY